MKHRYIHMINLMIFRHIKQITHQFSPAALLEVRIFPETPCTNIKLFSSRRSYRGTTLVVIGVNMVFIMPSKRGEGIKDHFCSQGGGWSRGKFSHKNILGSVQAFYKHVSQILDSHHSLNKQNKHGIRPPPPKIIYDTWMVICANVHLVFGPKCAYIIHEWHPPPPL